MEYSLPALPYDYNALEPFMDEQTLRLHHGKHHAAYVNGLNAALKKLEEARAKADFSSIRALETALAFHGSGHMLHSLFWKSMCAQKQSAEPKSGALFEAIARDFGSLESFKKQFSEAAKAVEGSGWAILVYEPEGKRLLILQVENHQKLALQGSIPLLALDVWEHAYYILYKSDRAKYIENWWNICDWSGLEKRLSAIKE
ncbi:MAG: superoxide dismutase [Candidatus Micrarchaeota archaeon]|nr:superoxide dismutase [Candidatus Micrarchaeota archaeon]